MFIKVYNVETNKKSIPKRLILKTHPRKKPGDFLDIFAGWVFYFHGLWFVGEYPCIKAALASVEETVRCTPLKVCGNHSKDNDETATGRRGTFCTEKTFLCEKSMTKQMTTSCKTSMKIVHPIESKVIQ